MSSGRILVVDDEPQIRRVMRVALSGATYMVADARSGEEALEKLREEKVDLVLLDVNLPGIGGIETCRAIRERSDVPVIMLTVRNSSRDAVAALDAGADDYVTKPFSMEVLLARIRATMRRSPNSPGGVDTLRFGNVEIRMSARRVTVESKSDSRRRSSTCCAFWLLIAAPRCRTSASCKPCGDRTTAARCSICAYSSSSCARSWSRIPPVPNTF
jgi:two-component system KDP operon response regulator KdpE